MSIFQLKKFTVFIFLLMLGMAGWLFTILHFCNWFMDDADPSRHKNYRELFETYKEKLKTKDAQIRSLQKVLNSKKPSQLLLQSLPIVYSITPTYSRPEQKAELVRLLQTFLHVRNFHWIVVEDAANKTNLVTRLLAHSGLNFTHLNIPTSSKWKLKVKDPNWLKPRGVVQRNLALKWLRENVNISRSKAVVYFADDDNTYSLELFEEMRNTSLVSVWPVALVGGLRYEAPIVSNNKVTGWFTYWKPQRPFAVDMAGFAVNLKLFFKFPLAEFSYKVERGYQESVLLTALSIKLSDLEPKADNCTKILVWHTRSEKSKLKNEALMKRKYGHGSDLNIEV